MNLGNLILQVIIDIGSLILALVIVIVLVLFLNAAIRVVREYERVVVFRLGRVIGVKGPGIVFLIPFIDRPVKVDLREQYIEVSRQTCITRDNAPVDIDFLIYFKVIDPLGSVLNVRDFRGAATGIATTTLRAVIGDIDLDSVLARREEINNILRVKLDEVTGRWGVKITTVEIREITPPREVQDAMIRQMSAERNRRAMVTEAEGKKESAILVADGEKQSAILKAEGERQALILKAEGYALALEKILEIAQNLDKNTMALQYLETLKEMAKGESTKIVLPMEFTKIIEDISRLIEGREGER